MRAPARILSILAPALFLITPPIAAASDLHFSHPLISESPSPDTKVRFDYLAAKEGGDEKG